MANRAITPGQNTISPLDGTERVEVRKGAQVAETTTQDIANLGGPGGGVTSLSGTAGQIATDASTGAVTVALVDTAVTADTYGDASNIAQFTVDEFGRITEAANIPVTTGGGVRAENGNTAAGENALPDTTDPNNNTAYGDHALGALVETPGAGIQNTAIGNGAGAAIFYAGDCVAIGFNALHSNVSGDRNIAIGTGAMQDAVLAGTSGTDNIAIGQDAMQSGTDGSGNIAIGLQSQKVRTTGLDNIAIGIHTLLTNESGSDNIAVGASALGLNTADANIAIGHNALQDNTTGTRNIALGVGAASDNHVTGDDNIAIGNVALEEISTGSSNIGIGSSVAPTLTTGSNNTVIGKGADVSAAAAANQTVIGEGAIGGANNTAQIGNTSTLSGRFGAPTTVAALPSAAAVGAGAVAWCTDLKSPTLNAHPVGGGTNLGQVHSDGVDWHCDCTVQNVTPGGPDGSVAGVLTINYDLGGNRNVSLTENVTSVVVTNFPLTGNFAALILNITNTGAFTMTGYPAGVGWANGNVEPVVTSGAGKRDKFILSSSTALVTADGDVVGQDY